MLDLILCESVDDLKGECTCTTRLREIVREVNWLATVIARIIKKFTVIAREQSGIVFCYYFLLSKGVSHALFVLASSSTYTVFIG